MNANFSPLTPEQVDACLAFLNTFKAQLQGDQDVLAETDWFDPLMEHLEQTLDGPSLPYLDDSVIDAATAHLDRCWQIDSDD